MTQVLSNSRVWQQSFGESNYSPIKLIPNIRVHPSLAITSSPETCPRYEVLSGMPSSAEQFNTMTLHEKLHVCKRSSPYVFNEPSLVPPNFVNGVTKFPDHRTKVKISPIRMRPATTLEPIANKKNFVVEPELQCSHESLLVLSPPKELINAYQSGLQVHSPLQIVTHQKRGVKLPRMSPEKPSNGVTRNHHGGYYSTMA